MIRARDHRELGAAVDYARDRAERELQAMRVLLDRERRYWVVPARTRGWREVGLEVGTVRPPGDELPSAPASIRCAAAVLHEGCSNPKLAPQIETPVGNRVRMTPRAPYCAETYASIATTCPSGCAFRGEGCYASSGFTGHTVRALDESSAGMDPDAAAREEAALVSMAFGGGPVPQDGQRGGRDLRLHNSGDVTTAEGASALARAAAEWRERGGGATWSYSHSWDRVPRSAWGEVSVLASVETAAAARRARLSGYATAIVVESHPSERAYGMDGLRVVPCPYETRGVSCVRCRLCLDADGPRERGVTIGFAVHGVQRERAKKRLRVLKEAA